MGGCFFSFDWTWVKTNRHVARVFWECVPQTNLTQIFIVPKLDWGNFSVKIRWSPKKKGFRRNPKAFSGQNQKFKRFFRPKTGDLQKKVFAEIRRLFLAEIKNLSGFSGQKQVIPQKKGLRRIPKAEIKNLSDFSKNRWSQIKKKKGVCRNPKAFSGRNHKFERFFRPKTVTFFSYKPALKSRSGDAQPRWGNAFPHSPTI